LKIRLTVDEASEGDRADSFVSQHSELTRTRAAELVREGRVRIQGTTIQRPSARVRLGDDVVVDVPPATPIEAVPQQIPLDITYEDGDVIVVNKPPGLVVHPAPGHPDGTLVNALLHHCTDLSGIGGDLRPGIVHRIDKDTSGLLVVTKNDKTHAHLQAQFAAHTVARTYLALCAQVRGPTLPDEARIETGHQRMPNDRRRFTGLTGGTRRAITNLRVVTRYTDGAMLVLCRLETGRTHQIRMHLSEHGAPILGDELYGDRATRAARGVSRLALHAASLGFEHPDGRHLYFEAPTPHDLQRSIDRLSGGASWRK